MDDGRNYIYAHKQLIAADDTILCREFSTFYLTLSCKYGYSHNKVKHCK